LKFVTSIPFDEVENFFYCRAQVRRIAPARVTPSKKRVNTGLVYTLFYNYK